MFNSSHEDFVICTLHTYFTKYFQHYSEVPRKSESFLEAWKNRDRRWYWLDLLQNLKKEQNLWYSWKQTSQGQSDHLSCTCLDHVSLVISFVGFRYFSCAKIYPSMQWYSFSYQSGGGRGEEQGQGGQRVWRTEHNVNNMWFAVPSWRTVPDTHLKLRGQNIDPFMGSISFNLYRGQINHDLGHFL